MAQIRDVIGYFCSEYPYKSELSKARLTKMVYLADWKSSVDTGKQITPIKWYFNHFGPYVDDVTSIAMKDDSFKISNTQNMFGSRKNVIEIVKKFTLDLSKQEIETLDFVIDATKSLTWENFIKLVYSTYPVLTTDKLSYLDLVESAKRYKHELENA